MQLLDYFVPFHLMNSDLIDKLSRCLNISRLELKDVEPDLCPLLDDDGTLISYTILFKENASDKILSKIEGLQLDKTVTLDLSPTPVVKMQRRKSLHNKV